MKQALDALETNKQKHDVCEDIFYSCPFYSGGACTCGADKANAEIHEVIASLRQAIAEAEKLEQEIKDILQNYPLTSLQLLNYVESTKTLYLIYPEESNEHRSNQTNGA